MEKKQTNKKQKKKKKLGIHGGKKYRPYITTKLKYFTWFIWRKIFFSKIFCSKLSKSMEFLSSLVSTLSKLFHTITSKALFNKKTKQKTVEQAGIQQSIGQCGILTKIEASLIFVSIAQNILDKFPPYKPCKNCSFVSVQERNFFFLHIDHMIIFVQNRKTL